MRSHTEVMKRFANSTQRLLRVFGFGPRGEPPSDKAVEGAAEVQHVVADMIEEDREKRAKLSHDAKGRVK